jgi:hypothetical protein
LDRFSMYLRPARTSLTEQTFFPVHDATQILRRGKYIIAFNRRKLPIPTRTFRGRVMVVAIVSPELF